MPKKEIDYPLAGTRMIADFCLTGLFAIAGSVFAPAFAGAAVCLVEGVRQAHIYGSKPQETPINS